ncbi:MAG TPA: cytochrome c [Oceanospirillales bacterium]|nr:cytochrome c [Oceanospirillales bacterium]
MKYKFRKLIITLLFSTIGSAADLDEGKEMYEEDCTKCHDSSVFTRKDRKVNNAESLTKQVHRCVTSQGYSWFEEDEENVTAYLSEAFYKFDKK